MLVDDDAGRILRADEINRLKWRCRRGLLENDLFLERFFSKYEAVLTVAQAQALLMLMELADNDLLDLLLARQELAAQKDLGPKDVVLEGSLHTAAIEVLKMLQSR
jgi:antitoxin CptB